VLADPFWSQNSLRQSLDTGMKLIKFEMIKDNNWLRNKVTEIEVKAGIC
jgi:hypothetical protein